MKLLQLSDVRKPLSINVTKSGQFDWFEYLCSPSYSGLMDFDVYLPSKNMNLQRPLVWTLEQKQELILSILKEIPIPKVSLIKYWDISNTKSMRMLKIEVIDGKQRMNAFIEFYKGMFALPSGHYFKDLDTDCRKCFFGFYTGKDECTMYSGEVSDESKIEWFSQINFSGTPQDRQHLDNLTK